MDRTHALDYGREIVSNRTANSLIGVAFFILATALGAYVRIPVRGSPVPITLQTFFVMLSAAVLGRRLGALSQFGYLALGALGLPIFQGFSGGVFYMLGPTGGYLAGFAAASYLIGYMLDSKRSNLGYTIASFATGDALIHVLGASWLVYLYKMDIARAFSAGVLPFIPGEIVKVSFAVIIYSGISKRSKEIFSR